MIEPPQPILLFSHNSTSGSNNQLQESRETSAMNITSKRYDIAPRSFLGLIVGSIKNNKPTKRLYYTTYLFHTKTPKPSTVVGEN